MKEPFEFEVASSDKHIANYDDLSPTSCVCKELEANASRTPEQTLHEVGGDVVLLAFNMGNFSSKLAATSDRKLSMVLISAIGVLTIVYLASGVGISTAVGIVAISRYVIRTLMLITSLSS